MRTHRFFILTAAILASASACSSTPTTTTTTSPPAPGTTAAPATAKPDAEGRKAAFLERANAICAEMNAKMARVRSTASGSAVTGADAAKLVRENADEIEDAVAQIRALPQPTNDESDLRFLYDDAAELVTLGRKMADAAAAGDRAEFDRLGAESNKVQKRLNADSTDYGLTECGKGS